MRIKSLHKKSSAPYGVAARCFCRILRFLVGAVGQHGEDWVDLQTAQQHVDAHDDFREIAVRREVGHRSHRIEARSDIVEGGHYRREIGGHGEFLRVQGHQQETDDNDEHVQCQVSLNVLNGLLADPLPVNPHGPNFLRMEYVVEVSSGGFE